MTKTVSIQTNKKHKEQQGKKIPIKELKHEQKNNCKVAIVYSSLLIITLDICGLNSSIKRQKNV